MKDSFKGEIIQSLPDQGKDPVFHLFLILRIALQSFFQNLFLIADPLGNHRKISKHNEKRNGGCENQRHSKEQDCRGQVHRMPDDSIQSRIDDFLVLLHLDGPGQVCILPENFSIEQIRKQKQSRNWMKSCRRMRPCIPTNR